MLLRIYRRKISMLRIKNDKTISIALSGCGWLAPFYLGVIKVLKSTNYLTKNSIYGGTSGGSLGALIGCADIDTDLAANLFITISKDKKFHKNIDQGIRAHLRSIVPEDVLSKVNDRLFIVTTKIWPDINNIKNPVITSNFKDIDHLVDVVSASCYIPLWSNRSSIKSFYTKIMTDPNSFYIDGGLASWMPPIGDVRVTPFPKTLILTKRKPHISLPSNKYSTFTLMSWVFQPPPPDKIMELYKEGEIAAYKWIENQPK
jgi:predicted acylesterase/phospholipase RssA